LTKKNSLIIISVLVILSMLILVGTVLAEDQVIRWKCQSGWQPNTFHHKTVVNWARRVEELSNNRIQIQVFSAGELIGPFETRQAVRDGAIDCAHIWSGFYAGTEIANILVGTSPAFMDNEAFLAWLMGAGGIDYWQRIVGDEIKVLFGGLIPPEMGIWTNKELNSSEDLKGIKFRGPIHMNEALEKFGVNSIFIPPGEIVPALYRGVVDALEFSNPTDDLAIGLHEVAEYQYLPGIQQQAHTLELAINNDKWNELTPDLQAIVVAATRLQIVEDYPVWWYEDTQSIKVIEKESNVEKISPEFQTQLLNRYIELYEEYAQKNELFAEIWNSQKKFMVDYYDYADLQEVEWLDKAKYLQEWANSTN